MNNRRGEEEIQLWSTTMMEIIMMKMVELVCWSDWMKFYRLNVVVILHIMLILIVYLSIICRTYNIYK